MPISPARSLLRAPVFSLTVALTLGLGVGALILTFSVINAALFRQPPFPAARDLALLFIQRNEEGELPRRERWSFNRFELLAKSQQSFERVASYSPASITVSGAGSNAELAQIERVSASYLPLLGANVVLGRLIAESDDDPTNPAPVVVLGHQLWTRRYASDPSIVGRTIRLNAVPLTVIGVMQPGFNGLSGRAEMWVPRTVSAQVTYAEYLTTNQNFISAVGRLRPGTSIEAAQSELGILGATINRAIPSDPQQPDERVTASAVPLNEARIDRTVRRSLYVVLTAMVLLHLLACANVVNLLLGRQAQRLHETSVRVALGSSSQRLFRHIFAESMVLGLFGGALGIALARLASTFLAPPANAWAPRNFYGSLAPFDQPAFGLTELSFGLLVMLATALVVSLPPALGAFRIDVAAGLHAGGRSVAENAITLRRPTARGVIVALEAALALLLVTSAGLLIDSFRRMSRASIGVNTQNVLTFWVIPSEARVPPATAPAFIAQLVDAVSRVPGAQSVTVDGGAPLAGSASTTLFISGRPVPHPSAAPPVRRHYVAPGHFITLGIPVRQGRVFTERDETGAPRVTVISESAARQFWPGQDPIGQRVWFSSGGGFSFPDSSAEVVGVVGDVQYAPLDQQPNLASFYTPYKQFTYAPRMFFVRTSSDPMSLVPDVRRAIATVDPELALQDVQPLDRVVTNSWARHRFDAFLFAGFGIAALMLAASGIFAVLSYAVASRTREFGIRIALGGSSGRVVRDVLREGMAYPIVGIALGIAGALAATRLLQASLYGISPHEPRVFVGTAALLALVAVAACLAPAWRATRVDPMEALRAE